MKLTTSAVLSFATYLSPKIGTFRLVIPEIIRTIALVNFGTDRAVCWDYKCTALRSSSGSPTREKR